MSYMTTRDASLTVRLSSATKESLASCALVKDQTVSAYVVDLLVAHVTEKGLPTSTPGIGRATRAPVLDLSFVKRQIINDLKRKHQLLLAQGHEPAVARTYIERFLQNYEADGVAISFEDLDIEE